MNNSRFYNKSIRVFCQIDTKIIKFNIYEDITNLI